MTAFLETNDISSARARIRVFLESLEKDALDLYLSIDTDKKADLSYLEQVFSIHFKPKKHMILGMSEILKSGKGLEESISEYYLRLRKKASEFSVGTEMLTAIFIQGMPVSYQKHIALKGVTSLDDVLNASREFERVSDLDSSPSAFKQVNSVDLAEIDVLKKQISRLNEIIEN